MQTNFFQYDPRDNFLALETDMNLSDDDDAVFDDDFDEIWEKYEDEDDLNRVKLSIERF